MEEKILIKGDFALRFIPIVLSAVGIFIFALFTLIDGAFFLINLIIAIIFIVAAIIANKALKKRELIVTNKRVIARGAFGYRTDLPIEKITNVSMRCFGGIGCGTPSTKIRFHFCKNKQEIFDTIASETLKRDSAFLG